MLPNSGFFKNNEQHKQTFREKRQTTYHLALFLKPQHFTDFLLKGRVKNEFSRKLGQKCSSILTTAFFLLVIFSDELEGSYFAKRKQHQGHSLITSTTTMLSCIINMFSSSPPLFCRSDHYQVTRTSSHINQLKGFLLLAPLSLQRRTERRTPNRQYHCHTQTQS